MTAQTDLYYTEKMKTARTESQFSQQPNELGIKVRSVLKSENRADRLLFYKINKKKTNSSQKMAVNFLNFSILLHVS